ncbi:MAG: hypothetical protein ABH826_01415 [Patescibacteria group bacterium]|nr:hypothetical protein [Patescibacteria group bacterium]
MQIEDDTMMQPMMANPPSPAKQKQWMIIAITSIIVLAVTIIVALVVTLNAKDKVRACDQEIASLELDVVSAEALTVQCSNELGDAGVQKVGEIEASGQMYGFQYPADISISKHIQAATAIEPLLIYRVNHDLISTCSECSPEPDVVLLTHTYDRTLLGLESGEKYSTRIIDSYNGSDYQDVTTKTEASRNGTLTIISGEQIGGYVSPDQPKRFETYIFEADKYVVVAWLNLSGSDDDSIVNFFHETLDTSEIE